VLALARFERPARLAPAAAPAESARGRLAAVVGLTYLVAGLFGLVLGGFAVPPDPGGAGTTLGFAADPLQSLACLLLGGLLLRAARGGAAAGSPAPWLVAAAVCALLLVPSLPGLGDGLVHLLAVGPANRLLHGAALVVALAAAAGARRGPPQPQTGNLKG
jgi:hypothetical protein